MASFDIKNIYTNIPTPELIQIITETRTHNHTHINITDKTLNIANLILNQNYLTFNGQHFTQDEGLAMDARTSAIFSEFLQSIEHSYI